MSHVAPSARVTVPLCGGPFTRRTAERSFRANSKLRRHDLPVHVQFQRSLETARLAVLRYFRRRRFQSRPPGQTVLETPLLVQRNGQCLRYVWSGNELQAVVDPPIDLKNSGDGLGIQKRLKAAQRSFVHVLFPSPDTVSADYWEWVSWRLFSRFFSTCLTIFGTQSLLMAVGLGAKRSLTASVAINWMVKDGMGRLARFFIAARFSQKFDSNVKKARFLSLLVFVCSVSGEYLTPFYPSGFLVLAAISNIGKAAITTAFVSTAPSLAITFARSHTVCDITAKTQAQNSVVDTSAIAVAGVLTHLCGPHPKALSLLPVMSYFFCSFWTLLGSYKENKTLVFKTLNAHRLNIVSKAWAQRSTALSPEQVCRLETVWGTCLEDDDREAEVKIGRLEDMADQPSDLTQIINRHRSDAFLMSLNRAEMREGAHKRPAFLISFKEGVENRDVILAFLMGAFARERLRMGSIQNRHQMAALLEAAQRDAQGMLSEFVAALESVGWRVADLPIHIMDVQYTRAL